MRQRLDANKCILRLENCTYFYEGEVKPVWQDLSCSFYRGKIHGIAGPSGCGKSSLLYLIDGLIPNLYQGKMRGTVFLEEKNVTDVSPRYKSDRIGFVMQNPESQFVTFTVEEELAFGMENLCVDPTEIGLRIKEVLEFIGMQSYEKADLDSLSGGQKQKIAIASVLVTEPDILLLDEPTANLDPESRKGIFDLINRLSKKKGITVILVEHNMLEMIENIDEILVLDKDGCEVFKGEVKGEEEKIRKFLTGEVSDFKADDLSTDEVLIDVKNLMFDYPKNNGNNCEVDDDSKIIDDLNLKIRRKEFVAIVGENGAGKTTLMKLLFRIVKPDSGDITLFGKKIENYKTKELYNLIGLVFQNPENQFVANTVKDEMLFSLKKSRLTQEQKEARINEMLLRFDLADDVEKSPFALSQGQKRRLSVASMLLTNQEILFLDEPTYGQDFENRQELMQDMYKLVESGITIVMITHDMSLVRQYASSVIELKEGKAESYESVEDYFSSRKEAI